MQQLPETLPVAQFRRQASPLDWRATAEWLHCHPQHDYHQDKGNGCWIADNWVRGFQLLMYEVPLTEESCSSTETKIAQKLTEDLYQTITNFHGFIIKRRRKENYELVLIRNMDKFLFGLTCYLLELWIRWKLSWSTQLVMRNCSSLSPLHVWQTEQSWSPWWTSKTLPRENFPPGVLVHCHVKVWMDEAGVKLWVEKVWQSWSISLLRKKGLLVWVSFQGHLANSVKRAVCQTNTNIAVIPGGLTSILQPLDISLNKPFKYRLWKQWNNWMIEGQKSSNPAGNMRAASLLTVCLWVLDAWRSLPAEVVAWSFEKHSISKFKDGTEDKILWDDTEANVPVPTTPVDDEDEDERVYAYHLISEEWQNLLGKSDDEEFPGFEWAGTLLTLQTASLGTTKLTSQWPQQICVFIYSLYLFPALPWSFFLSLSCLVHATLRKHVELIS